MPVNSLIAPPPQVEQARKALIVFYQKPIAQVSTELFFTIGAIIFFALFAIRPTVLTMTELVKEIEDKEKLSEALSRKVTSLASVSTQYFGLQDELPFIDAVIPEYPVTQSILTILEKVASDNQIFILSTTVKELPASDTQTIAFNKKQPTYQTITVAIQSDFASVQNFLKTLSTLSPLCTVESISFSQIDDKTASSQLTTNIQIRTHYYSQNRKDTQDSGAPAQESEESQ